MITCASCNTTFNNETTHCPKCNRQYGFERKSSAHNSNHSNHQQEVKKRRGIFKIKIATILLILVSTYQTIGYFYILHSTSTIFKQNRDKFHQIFYGASGDSLHRSIDRNDFIKSHPTIFSNLVLFRPGDQESDLIKYQSNIDSVFLANRKLIELFELKVFLENRAITENTNNFLPISTPATDPNIISTIKNIGELELYIRNKKDSVFQVWDKQKIIIEQKKKEMEDIEKKFTPNT